MRYSGRHLSLLFLLLMFMAIGSHAQQPTRPVKTRPVKTKPVEAVTPPVNVLPPKTTEPSRPTVPGQPAHPPIEQLVDLEALNAPLNVSQPYRRTLSDPQIFVDERGYSGMSIRIIRRTNGHYALVYGASTENLEIYTKGLYFTLDEQLRQVGRPIIVTKYDEDLRQVLIQEVRPGGLEIVYTCNDERGVYTTGASRGERDRSIHSLKFTEIEPGGGFHHRMVDKRLGNFDLKALIKPPNCDNTSVLYNYEGHGRLALVDSYLGTYEMFCDLKPLSRKEMAYSNQNIPSEVPRIATATPYEDKFVIHSADQRWTTFWNLTENGLRSGISERAAWPLLVLDGFAVSSGQGANICHYENHPYHPFTDPDLKLAQLLWMAPLPDGSVGAIDGPDGAVRFHVFDDQLKRVHPPVLLPGSVQPETVQPLFLPNDRILIFYRTRSGDQFEYRALIYDHRAHEVLLSGEDILWEEPYRDWPPVYQLVRHDDRRVLAVTFDQPTSTYVHEQDLIYRILTLNLPERED